MKKLALSSLLIVIGYFCQAQGVSFSYLIPKNGYISAPVSPLSVRGLGFGSYVGAETGFTVYNVPGLAMESLPFDYDKPLTGPHFALLVPAEAFIRAPLGPVTIKVMGGGFIWWNINTRINEGNMDRAFRDYKGWDVLNTDLDLNDKLGFGWMAGIEFEFPFNDKFSIIVESQYLKGAAKSELSGTYSGGNVGESIQTETLELTDAEITIQGLEISLGVQLNQ